MKKKVQPKPPFTHEDIRSYAEHLYEQGGRIAGRDLDNWLEARACLEANIPREQSHRRLSELRRRSASQEALKQPHPQF